MDQEELETILSNMRRIGADHSKCEVKKSQGGLPQSMWETISAFANAQGGTIILGVEEKKDFAVVGVRDAGQIESSLGAVCSEMEPPIRADIHTLHIEEKSVVIAEIPAIPRSQRPCHKRSLGPWSGSRYRVADGDRKLTDYEISVLLANRAEQKYDLAPVLSASIEDLDKTAVEGFLRNIRETKGPIFDSLDDEESLVMLNVLTRHEGELYPTLGGLLSFGLYPQRYEPQLNITIVAYPSTEAGELGPRGERFIENRSVDGSIPLMVRESIRTLKRNMKRRSIVTGLLRTDEWEYPEEVLREAIANALVHRDYSEYARGMQVQIELYPDRLVIRNPGGLYGPVDVTSLGTSGVSSSRNRALLKILEDTPLGDGYKVCENRGTGITRMRLALTQAGMESPTFIDEIGVFEAEFPNHTLLDQEALNWIASLDARPLTRQQMTALIMMRNGRPLTNSSYRSATGVQDSRAASKDLKELVERGIVEQVGTRGAAYYQLAQFEASEDSELEFAEPDEESEEQRIASLTKLQRTVFDSLGDDPLSRSQIAEATGLPSSQVSGALTALREKGLAHMEGVARSRNTTWRRSSSYSDE